MHKNYFLILSFIFSAPFAYCQPKAMPEMLENYPIVREKVDKETEQYFYATIPNKKEQAAQRQFANQFMKFLFANCLSSKQCAESLLRDTVQGELKTFIIEKITAQVVQNMTRNGDVVDEATVRPIVVKLQGKKIEDDIVRRNLIVAHLDNYYIQWDIEQAVKKEQEKLMNQAVQQGAGMGAGPRAQDEIRETYPEFNEKNADGLRRNKTFFSEVEILKRNKFREPECPVCSQNFKQSGHRVNLYCGHSICPTCLKNWIHGQGKDTCPLCRAEIKREEFSKNYLAAEQRAAQK
ncbi:E3 ubiquitin protein ligase [Candidatus Dependentiae bacterium]|nr:E3 ubiquitin protein ligase [Candidatus Dependentiae bacterium]